MRNKQLDQCVRDVWDYYDQHGRHDLPWRKNTSSYNIVVSEIMLQQTQVSRVVEYFDRWMERFPDFATLADAPLHDVLLCWQGLGYNRRGKYLHELAKQVIAQYNGILPKEMVELQKLPGIGPYTAGAIMAFAYDTPALFLETNIRTVLIHYMYAETQEKVPEKQLFTILEQLFEIDGRAKNSPREWYWAMMDYGAFLKQTVGNLNKRSASYVKQSRFEGSRRQLRAGIVRYVLQKKQVDEREIVDQSKRDRDEVLDILAELVQEGMLSQKGVAYMVK